MTKHLDADAHDIDFDRYMNNGFAPVPWKHHPEPIKELIVRARTRPRIKCCFEVCGKVVLAARGTEYADAIRYHEGLAAAASGVLIPHAWVRFDGKLVELTFREVGVAYNSVLALTPEEVAAHALKYKTWGCWFTPTSRHYAELTRGVAK